MDWDNNKNIEKLKLKIDIVYDKTKGICTTPTSILEI